MSSLYNPYAPMPSMHAGYAVIVGVATFGCARTWPLRTAGVLYPLFVLCVIVATGNHFFLDAAAGSLVATAGGAVARAPHRPQPQAEVIPIGAGRATRSDRVTGRAA